MREILIQLIQLEQVTTKLSTTNDALDREKQFEVREQALSAKELDAQKALTTAAERESTVEKERAETYKELYSSVKKQPGTGFGCRIKQIFTLGLGRCGE